MTDEEYLRMRKAARRRRQHRQRNYHLFAGACILWAIVIVWFIFLMWPRAAENLCSSFPCIGKHMIFAEPAPEPLDPAPEPVLATEEVTEAERIEAALLESGYLRDDIPLSYELQDVLRTECEKNGIPYHIALGLIQVESSFREDADNGLCYGLCQLNRDWFPNDLTPAENIREGMAYLSYQLGRYGDIEKALTAYNAGHDTGKRGYANAVLLAAAEWEGRIL